jgi:hypothetical protein
MTQSTSGIDWVTKEDWNPECMVEWGLSLCSAYYKLTYSIWMCKYIKNTWADCYTSKSICYVTAFIFTSLPVYFLKLCEITFLITVQSALHSTRLKYSEKIASVLSKYRGFYGHHFLNNAVRTTTSIEFILGIINNLRMIIKYVAWCK